jgi:hypothetical protein
MRVMVGVFEAGLIPGQAFLALITRICADVPALFQAVFTFSVTIIRVTSFNGG